MNQPRPPRGGSARIAFLALLSGSLLNVVSPLCRGQSFQTTLKPETVEAYAEYVGSVESEMAETHKDESGFLWTLQEAARREQVLEGEIAVKQIALKSVPKGLIHDWIGSVLVRDVDIPSVLSLLQDYDRHKEIYQDVVDSKVLDRSDRRVRGFLRFKRTQVLTVVLNTEHLASYTELNKGRWHGRSESTRITEVTDAGSSSPEELPEGRGRGFLWKMNVYWKIQRMEGGVLLECRAISLSRSIPAGLGWILRPIVSGMPEDSLISTLQATRDELIRAARD